MFPPPLLHSSAGVASPPGPPTLTHTHKHTSTHRLQNTHPRKLLTLCPPTCVFTHALTLIHTDRNTHTPCHTGVDTHILQYIHAPYSLMHVCTFPYMFPQRFVREHACSHTDARLFTAHTHTHRHTTSHLPTITGEKARNTKMLSEVLAVTPTW